jgi:hypothetical protein
MCPEYGAAGVTATDRKLDHARYVPNQRGRHRGRGPPEHAPRGRAVYIKPDVIVRAADEIRKRGLA